MAYAVVAGLMSSRLPTAYGARRSAVRPDGQPGGEEPFGDQLFADAQRGSGGAATSPVNGEDTGSSTPSQDPTAATSAPHAKVRPTATIPHKIAVPNPEWGQRK